MDLSNKKIKTSEVYAYQIEAGSAGAAVLDFLHCDDANILELGAGPGSISRVIASQPNRRVSAVDLDPACVRILKTFCVSAARVDLNRPNWVGRVPAGPYDAVVIADVLEHLYDPWSTLRSAKALLSDTGHIVISLPHSGHAGLLAAMMSNDFPYYDYGLLDRTHIRFFAMKTIQTLISGANLKIVGATFVIREPEVSEFQKHWLETPKRQRKLLMECAFPSVYQVVVDVVPVDRNGVALDLMSLPASA